MFVVNYTPVCGRIETFGFFNTELDAKNWAEKDVEYNIENARKNGVELHVEPDTGYNQIEIADYGTWTITKVTPVG